MRGHVSPRYTSNTHCVVCHRARSRRDVASGRGNAHRRKRYRKNREKLLSLNREWRASIPGVVSQLFNSCKLSSIQRDHPLPTEDLRAWLIENIVPGAVCPGTGLPMTTELRSPWKFSIDRIDSSCPLGYTNLQNLRIVCWRFNQLRECYGDDLAATICIAQFHDTKDSFEIRELVDPGTFELDEDVEFDFDEAASF